MSDYLRSAFGYLNGGGGGSAGGGATSSSDYVGQVIEISGVKLRVNRLIAEGGWALVYAVEDVSTGKEYALKRMLAADEEAKRTIVQEIETLKGLSNHANVVQFLCAQQAPAGPERPSGEYLLVTELCPGGTLADVLRAAASAGGEGLGLAQVCRLAYQAARAVHHMHSQQPQPLAHRDIKLENLLLGADGLVKLCDFGSASARQILPDASWSAQRRAQLEDHLAKFSTPMYRAPEMLDTWSNEPIGPPVDCWALGCVLYALLTLRHPFPEASKLAIVNGKYAAPPQLGRLGCLADLVAGCLCVSPTRRLTAAALLERLAAVAESHGFDPREPAGVRASCAPTRPAPAPPSQQQQQPPTRPAPPAQPPQQQPQHQQHKAPPAGLLSSLKGGAGSLFRNIKDTSSKVMQTVQQSMARTELDASYLTSRLLVMPYPADGIESAYRANHVEDVRAFLQARHPPPTRLQFYNLSRGRPNVARLVGRHVDCSFAYASAEASAPLLSAVYQICQDIYRYLDADVHHLVVLYCNDGLRASALVACALLLYAGVFGSAPEAIGLFTTRRCQPPQLQPSELRVLDYMASLAAGELPHVRPLLLRALVVQPVPLFTKARDGCRPFVEVYSNGAMVYSTRRPEYEEMRLHSASEASLRLGLGEAAVRGDITLVLYHARQQLGRVLGLKMAALHFHTGYVAPCDGRLAFERGDLDDTPEVGGAFGLALEASLGEDSAKFARVPAPWEDAAAAAAHGPEPLFASTLEMEETLDSFRADAPQVPREQPRRPPPPSRPPAPAPAPAPEKPPRRPTAAAEEEPQQPERAPSPAAAEADLLNLGPLAEPHGPAPQLDIFAPPSPGPVPADEDDVFGVGFGAFTSAPPTTPVQPPLADLLGQSPQPAPRPAPPGGAHALFDPFGQTDPPAPAAARSPGFAGAWGAPPPDAGLPRNASVPNLAPSASAPRPADPFASLASAMGAGLAASWNGAAAGCFAAQPREAGEAVGGGPRAPSAPPHSSPRTHRPAAATPPEGQEQPRARPADAFEELLGSQGYSFASRKADKDSPKTINQMRRVEAARTMDPEKLRVAEWAEGKKGNLRALLCSLHTVLWDDCKWQKCEMHALVSAADVKRSYRKACLAVHPDKQAGTANESLAKLVFMELNNAWSTFENDASQQNLFS